MKTVKIIFAVFVAAQWVVAVPLHRQTYPLTPFVSPRFSEPKMQYTRYTTNTKTTDNGKDHHVHFELKSRCERGDSDVSWETVFIHH